MSRERLPLAGALLSLLLCLPVDLVGQTCDSRPQAPGSTSVAVQTRDLVRNPTLGVTHYRSHIWVGVFAGDTPPTTEFIAYGSDINGNFLGHIDYSYFGGGVKLGADAPAGLLMFCLDGGLSVGLERAAKVKKYYYNAFGQTIGIGRGNLADSGLRSWLWSLNLSVDHSLFSDLAVVGVGIFVERSLLFDDDTPDAIQDYSYTGAAPGLRALLGPGILVEASYRYPIATFGDEFETPDGWFVIELGWLF